MSVRIFVGKKIVGKKICHWQKILHFLATFFLPIRYLYLLAIRETSTMVGGDILILTCLFSSIDFLDLVS